MIKIIELTEHTDLLDAIMSRAGTFDAEVDRSVSEIVRNVRIRGDAALLEYSERFDRVRPDPIRVSSARLEQASHELDPELINVILEAAANIRRFHEHQKRISWFVEDGDGVILGQRVLPLERVGLYVPGGTAFYPSSLLMNAIPAQVAGVEEICLVSPPMSEGLPHTLVLATANLLGLNEVYAVGGAQAIAALAFGTNTINRVDKIVGPGNAYVAAAKKQVFGPVDIDAIAGPTEVVILADDSADPAFIASDLLAQAEHDVRASAILVTPSRSLAESVREEVKTMIPNLSRRTIIEQALASFGACIVSETIDQAIDVVNRLASEHLELLVHDPWSVLHRIKHAGAIFLGPYSSEPVGDYFAGPNHVLPTGGTARYASALGVDDFIRKQSIISYSSNRLQKTGQKIIKFAESEQLTAHASAIRVRLDRR